MEGAGGIGGLLARSHGYSSGNWSTHSYYHADGNGNITYLLNAGQSMVASYKYDAYGNTLASSGSLSGANNYRFSSKERLPVQDIYGSELYYYGYRFYQPSLQRWLNRDPLGELGFELVQTKLSMVTRIGPDGLLVDPDLTLYTFAANNSINFVDPDGRSIRSACDLCFVTPAYLRAVDDYNAVVKKLNEKYGPTWPVKIEEAMDQWRRELARKFNDCVTVPAAKTVPGTMPKGPVTKRPGL
jgi:RHS repeat-associated protein